MFVHRDRGNGLTTTRGQFARGLPTIEGIGRSRLGWPALLLALASALAGLARLRRDLEAGRALEAVDLTRLEHSALAVLGTLGRFA